MLHHLHESSDGSGQTIRAWRLAAQAARALGTNRPHARLSACFNAETRGAKLGASLGRGCRGGLGTARAHHASCGTGCCTGAHGTAGMPLSWHPRLAVAVSCIFACTSISKLASCDGPHLHTILCRAGSLGTGPTNCRRRGRPHLHTVVCGASNLVTSHTNWSFGASSTPSLALLFPFSPGAWACTLRAGITPLGQP